MVTQPHLPTYLRAVLSAVENDLAPTLTGEYVRHRAELIQMVLLRLIADAESVQDQGYATRLGAEVAMLAADSTDAPAPITEALREVRNGWDFSTAGLEHSTTALLEALAGTQRGSSPAGAGPLAALDTVIAGLARAEHQTRQDIENRIVANRERVRVNRTSSFELAISADTLTRYLQRRFPEQTDIQATGITTIPGGRSKGTILFDCVGGGKHTPMVIRKDFSKNFMGCTVSDEYPIVRAAWQAGLPVPEPYWLESDAGILDGRFIVFARVRGKAAGTMFEPKTTPAVVRELAAVIAKLHALDIRKAGLTDTLEFAAAPFAVGAMIEKSYQKHRARKPLDLLYEAAHAWLMNHLGCVQKDTVLVHGDLALHNVMADGTVVTALLDWEMAHAGDPAEDLLSLKALAETLIPWSEFMDLYVQHGGAPVSAERERFFSIWKLLKYSLYASSARDMFESDVDGDLRLAAIGYNTYSRLQNNLARELSLPLP